mgnify:CR=1 FL=1
MANCVLCNSYYKNHSYNNSKLCDFCQEEKDDWYEVDESEQLEIQTLLNPSGKTPPSFIDH